jgi:hypothetical protein
MGILWSDELRRTGLALVVAAILPLPAPGSGQVVSVKTVPVAAGDQFLIFPSGNLAMGGISLALPDTLGDPFSNPATGSRVGESFFFGTPALYHISGGNGSGRTLPLGTLFSSEAWFGGGAVALQELTAADREPWFVNPWLWGPPVPEQLLSEGSARNLYAFGLLGRRFPRQGISVGVSGSYADLGAVDGVDLLYAMSREIQQSGHLSDLRLGVLKEWEGDRSLELLLLRTRLRMRHDVTYLDLLWTPGAPDESPLPLFVTRDEVNLDHTDTWGAHLAYRRALQAKGWRIGWSLTGNWKDHPKIPNYEIQNIPRDPGNTRAYGVGVGLSKVGGPTRFGVDLVLEPIRSETWADAAADTTSVTGEIIPAGEKTVENDFRFTNVLVRAGGSWDWRRVTFKGGVLVRSISYEMEQFNRVEAQKRNQDESWMEWTPTLGVGVRLEGAEIHYAARILSGTGRPGIQWTGQPAATMDLAQSLDFLVAPSGPLTLQDARVVTHQLAVVIPIR